MTTNRIVVVLLAATLAMQFAIYFRGRSAPNGQRAESEYVTKPPKGTVLDIADMPALGKEDSPLVLVEFSDYECPFCARHANQVSPSIAKEYVESGKLRLVFANNTLPIHKSAKLLATAAICAGDQNHYWPMHDLLFKEIPKTEEEIMALVPKLSLDAAKFQSCMKSGSDPSRRIESDLEKVKSLGIQGTPSFALGRRRSDGKVEVEKLIRGAGPLNVFQREINATLLAQVR